MFGHSIVLKWLCGNALAESMCGDSWAVGSELEPFLGIDISQGYIVSFHLLRQMKHNHCWLQAFLFDFTPVKEELLIFDFHAIYSSL